MKERSNEELRIDIEALQSRAERFRRNAKKQGRQMTIQESSLVDDLEAKAEEVASELKTRPANGPVTLQNGPLGGGMHSGGNGRPYALRKPGDPKDHAALFGTGGYQWPDKDTSFFSAVFSGRHHPGLIQNASMTETVPSDGGFLVPTQTASRIHNVSLENELVMPKAFVQPMSSNECNLPGMEIGDHSVSLMGGFVASYTGELGTISENNPKSRGMTLAAKKLTGLVRFSNELAADIPGGEDQIINLCGKGLSWYRDKAFLKGTGAGEPLGILNSPCLVVVDKEGGQGNEIMYENLTKMMSRMFAGSFANSVWVAHQTLIPSLLQLSIAIGTGGSHIPVMTQANGQFQILTRPVIFTEKTEILGSQGDLVLADFSQYVVGLRQGMRFDTSIHVGFQTDELLARIIERHDGQPLWDKALTLADGSTTVSPFVTLEAR